MHSGTYEFTVLKVIKRWFTASRSRRTAIEFPNWIICGGFMRASMFSSLRDSIARDIAMVWLFIPLRGNVCWQIIISAYSRPSIFPVRESTPRNIAVVNPSSFPTNYFPRESVAIGKSQMYVFIVFLLLIDVCHLNKKVWNFVLVLVKWINAT